MGSCHSSNSKVKSRKKLDQKFGSTFSLSESIVVDDQLDSLTLKNNDLSAYIDLNSSLFHKNSASMSSFSSNKSSDPGKQARAIPVLNKLVYKPRDPHLATSTSSVITSESKQSIVAKSATGSPISNLEYKTQIKIEQAQDTKSLRRATNITRREFSPFRSFLKPPSAIVNKCSDKNSSSNSSLTQHNQSSSLSSLSSTSSSISNNKTIECKPKSSLVPAKKVPKSPIKTSQLPSTSKLRNSNTSITSLAKSENVEKNDKQSTQNRRLFSPYKFSSSLTKPAVLTENINRDNSVNIDAKKPESSSTNASKENTNNQTGLSKLKFSYNKIPSATKNNTKTLNQGKLNKLTDKSGEGPGMLKRDDSAYNSSTSSTVSSSNDAEDGSKETDQNEKQTVQSNIEESVGQLNQLIVSSSTINSSTGQQQDEGQTTCSSSTPKASTNLPSEENAEMVILDIDTYQQLMQDLQNCKIIMHKLGAILKEPGFLGQNGDQNQANDVDSVLNTFYQHQNCLELAEKIDQSTQTDLV